MKALLPILLRDGAGIGGALLVSYGAWRVYEPAGFIVLGMLLLAAAWRAAKVQS